MTDIQIPGQAVSGEKDLRQPARALLEDLNLLGTPEETKAAGSFGAVLSGPPQSVAVIEAGATAATKAWTAGLGASVIATWVSVHQWYAGQAPNVKLTALGGAAFVTAALVLAIGYLVASDVRGRAAASVATIDARALIAKTMIQAAEDAHQPAPAAPSDAVQLIALPHPLPARNLGEEGPDEGGWRAIAIERYPDGTLKYVVVKGSSEATKAVSEIKFE